MIIKFLLNEIADASDIVDRLHAQFREHVYKFRTVQFWITEARLDHQDLHDEIRIRISPLDDLETKILTILDKSLFKSAHSISETLRVAYPTLLLHLHDSIGFRSFYLHWVPHLLTHDLCESQKEHAKAMLPFLHTSERDGWHHLVTDDES
jgi:hypothetical protein